MIYSKTEFPRGISGQTISDSQATADDSVRSGPGLKPQASSFKLQASEKKSGKRQAPSTKLQAPSPKHQAPWSLNLEKVSRTPNRGALLR